MAKSALTSAKVPLTLATIPPTSAKTAPPPKMEPKTPIPLPGSIILSPKAPSSITSRSKTAEDRYGWGKFTPACLQWFHRPHYLLVCLCLLLTIQGMVVNGILPASVSHLERRFHFTSAQIGFFNSVYDMGVLVLLLPISHYGSRGHKGHWIAISAVLTALSSVICVLPHFLVETYQYGVAEPEQYCERNASDWTEMTTFSNEFVHPVHVSNETDACARRTGRYRWKYLFYVGQLLLGMGSAPLFTLAIAYLDENVPKKVSSIYTGIYHANVVIGPCLGYAAAASLSRTYGDFDKVDVKTVPITPDDPRWYGAWWVGVLGAGLSCLILAIPISGFARELPGSATLRSEYVEEAHNCGISLQLSTSMADWGEFKHRLRVILKNPTYICLIVEQCATTFIVGGLGAFATKYLETQFSMTTTLASIAAASTAIPPSLVGIILGTFMQRRWELQCTGNIILSAIATALATCFWLFFLVTCPTRLFGAVTAYFNRINATVPAVYDPHLAEECNTHCECGLSRFEPVCLIGEDNISYFSKCHAACSPRDLMTNISDCLCTGNGTLVDGICESKCSRNDYLTFLGGFALLILLVNMKKNPVQQATLRCVPFNIRNVALSLGWIPIRLFGCIPAAPFVGWLLNSACLVWQENCGVQEVCVLYDNPSLAAYVQIAGVVSFFFAYLALLVAWKLYAPLPVDEGPQLSSGEHSSLLQEALRSSWPDPVLEP